MLNVKLELSQYPWDGGFSLGNANDRAQKDGGDNPEVQSREGNAMGFHIDEHSVTRSACSRRGCGPKNSNADCSNKECFSDNDWEELCGSIGGKCAAGLADC